MFSGFRHHTKEKICCAPPNIIGRYATLHFSSWLIGWFWLALPVVCFAGAKNENKNS
jgi:hypothetical protein